jgi:hypothetical protein
MVATSDDAVGETTGGLDVDQEMGKWERLLWKKIHFGTAATPESTTSAAKTSRATRTKATTSETDTKTTTRRRTRTATKGTKDEPKTDHDSELPPRECKPPITGLSVALNEAKWNAAREAEPGSPESYFSYQFYEGPAEPPSTEPTPVQVHYCKTVTEMEDVCTKYFADEKIVGVDLEWQVYIRKHLQDDPRQHVSLIQMSSPTHIALFHLALFSPSALDGFDEFDSGAMKSIPGPEDLIAPTFRAMMADPSIIKLGVCIMGDTNRMKKYLDVDTIGSFELSHLWKVVRYRPYRHMHKKVNRSPVRLALQVKDILGIPMYKENDVRASDWTRPLSQAQIEYSATDAFAYIQLYHMMEQERLAMQNPPPFPGFAESKQPLLLGAIEDDVVSEVEGSATEDTESRLEAQAACQDVADLGEVAEDSEDVDVDVLAARNAASEAVATEPEPEEIHSHGESESLEPAFESELDAPDSQETIRPVSHGISSAAPAEEDHDSSSFDVWHEASATNPDANDTEANEYVAYREPSDAYSDEYSQEYSPEAREYGTEYSAEYSAEYGAEYTPEGWEYSITDSPLPPPVSSEHEPADELASEPEPEFEDMLASGLGSESVSAFESAPETEEAPETEPEPEPEPESEIELGLDPESAPDQEPAFPSFPSEPESAPDQEPAFTSPSPEPESGGFSEFQSKPNPKLQAAPRTKSNEKKEPASSSSPPRTTPGGSISSKASTDDDARSGRTTASMRSSSRTQPKLNLVVDKSQKDPRVVLAEKLVGEYIQLYGRTGFGATTDVDADVAALESEDDGDTAELSSSSSDDLGSPGKRAARVALRAYFLWRANRDLSPACIGELLRDPPLSPRTVGSYIAQAVRREKLPYETGRLHAEIMPMLPKQIWKKARPTH